MKRQPAAEVTTENCMIFPATGKLTICCAIIWAGKRRPQKAERLNRRSRRRSGRANLAEGSQGDKANIVVVGRIAGHRGINKPKLRRSQGTARQAQQQQPEASASWPTK